MKKKRQNKKPKAEAIPALRIPELNNAPWVPRRLADNFIFGPKPKFEDLNAELDRRLDSSR